MGPTQCEVINSKVNLKMRCILNVEICTTIFHNNYTTILMCLTFLFYFLFFLKNVGHINVVVQLLYKNCTNNISHKYIKYVKILFCN
jgi:hypothetical protein